MRIDGRDDYFDDNSPVHDNDILFYGGCGSEDGINFAAYIKVLHKGGKVYPYGSFITCEDCDEVTILLGAQTSYRCEDYKGQAVFDVERAEEKPMHSLKLTISQTTSHTMTVRISPFATTAQVIPPCLQTKDLHL